MLCFISLVGFVVAILTKGYIDIRKTRKKFDNVKKGTHDFFAGDGK